jgi:hypothetical protein
MSLNNQKSKELWINQRFGLQPVSKSSNPPVLTKIANYKDRYTNSKIGKKT